MTFSLTTGKAAISSSGVSVPSTVSLQDSSLADWTSSDDETASLKAIPVTGITFTTKAYAASAFSVTAVEINAGNVSVSFTGTPLTFTNPDTGATGAISVTLPTEDVSVNPENITGTITVTASSASAGTITGSISVPASALTGTLSSTGIVISTTGAGWTLPTSGVTPIKKITIKGTYSAATNQIDVSSGSVVLATSV